jgi:hypothetical protein|tara:strand:+ start:473 stop:1000 length:528 start_codon:yes stop_codon:yes gene_type:complete
MPQRNEPLLEAPIPGMSMTHEVGARPWQQPSKYTTIEEASRYYITRMQDKTFTDTLVNVLEMGVPVTTLANTIQMASVMQGLHTIDVGMLALPVIMETIMLVADSADIKYNTGLDKDDTVALASKSNDIDTTIFKLGDLVNEKDNDEDLPIGEDMIEEDDMLEEEEPSMGLMARR